MIKIDDHTPVDLDALAVQHYNNLVGVTLVDGVNYHATASLIGRINAQKLIDAAIPDPQRVAFWDYFLNNQFANLKRAIVGRPDIHKLIIADINNLFGVGFLSTHINYDHATLTDFGIIVKRVFNYKLYRTKPECEANCNQFNLAYCPYCNEQVTQVITRINALTLAQEEIALLQLDHFYPQSRHPYLSVSLFNLIPGCSVCNAQLKLEKRFDIDTHFNPFHRRFDDHFVFQLSTIVLNSESDVVIDYSDRQPPYPGNAIVDFEIIPRYKSIAHRRVAFKLVKTFKNHSAKIRRSIAQQIVGLFAPAESKTEILLDICDVPLNRNEINHVQFGKLKRDLAIQLGIL